MCGNALGAGATDSPALAGGAATELDAGGSTADADGAGD